MHKTRAIVLDICELGALGAFLGMIACLAAYCGA
jgi:hypothetical protein